MINVSAEHIPIAGGSSNTAHVAQAFCDVHEARLRVAAHVSTGRQLRNGHRTKASSPSNFYTPLLELYALHMKHLHSYSIRPQ